MTEAAEPDAAGDRESQKRPQLRGNRRVTAPATSGQPETVESQVYNPLDGQRAEPDHETDRRMDWLKSQKPPHWGS